LLIRDAGSVRLTAKGESLLIKTREVLWAGEALIEEAGRRELIEETIRLGVTELVACTWLQGFLRRMKEAYPNVRIQLEVDLSTAIGRRLVEGQIDLALQTGPFKSKSFASDPLGQEAYCWVANSDLIQHVSPKPSLPELFELTILTHAKHTKACAALHDIVDQHGLRRERIVHSSALSACLPMVLEGLGVALLPKRLVKAEIAPTRVARYVERAAQIAKVAMQAQ